MVMSVPAHSAAHRPSHTVSTSVYELTLSERTERQRATPRCAGTLPMGDLESCKLPEAPWSRAGQSKVTPH
jgi:hypothetical protein